MVDGFFDDHILSYLSHYACQCIYFYHVICFLHCFFFFRGDEVGYVVAEVHSFEGSGRILVVRIMKSGILILMIS